MYWLIPCGLKLDFLIALAHICHLYISSLLSIIIVYLYLSIFVELLIFFGSCLILQKIYKYKLSTVNSPLLIIIGSILWCELYIQTYTKEIRITALFILFVDKLFLFLQSTKWGSIQVQLNVIPDQSTVV